jgi:DNA-binding response OmpR family regulator
MLLSNGAVFRIIVGKTMVPENLLVIVRTQSLARRLQDALGADAVRARWLPSTSQALGLEMSPALVILELPDSGGERNTVRLKRRFDAPLLVLYRSAQPLPDAADASLCRPFRMAQLAHLVQKTLQQHAPGILQVAGMSLDTQNRRLQVGERFHQLPPIGCQILALLMETPGRVVARDEFFLRVWNIEDGDSTRTLDVHVSHLRRIVEPDPRHPSLIVTERGLGYRLESPALR